MKKKGEMNGNRREKTEEQGNKRQWKKGKEEGHEQAGKENWT